LGREVTRGKRSSTKAPETKRELIVAHWHRLRQPVVGAAGLKAIQEKLAKHYGANDSESPAAIARVLADEGAELRHPEVIEFDAQWREQQIKSQMREFDSLEPLTFERAEQLIKRWEQLRECYDVDLTQSRNSAIDARKQAQLLAGRKSLSEAQRAEQLEIAEWLGVWIKTPILFADWLELRRRSAEFRRKFPAGSQSRER
jgi:hypothetical protein